MPEVLAIHLSPSELGPLKEVESVRAVPGKGLEGDRYFVRAAESGTDLKPHQQLTLIEAEAIEAVERENGIVIKPGQSRRNVTTRGVPLNHLVGREFTLGDVRARGVELCEPCGTLQTYLDEPKLVSALLHRGGLRAEILTEGTLRRGDLICW